MGASNNPKKIRFRPGHCLRSAKPLNNIKILIFII
jgi:hypothetical protein